MILSKESLKKRGFTLAEVLITLGIIGVVAAMTLPALVNNNKNKELETRFRKSYSLLSQVLQRVVVYDYGGVYQPSSVQELVNSIQKYYNKSSTCINGQQCSSSIFPVKDYTNSYPQIFLQSTYKTFIGNTGGLRFNDGIMAAVDGSFIFFDYAQQGEITYGTYLIAIDVNGWKSKPNRYGHDFFVFQLGKNGALIPMGREGTYFEEDEYCSLTSNSAQNGYGCTARAVSDRDYFKKLPK
uniref:type II secretion system protein n=1 Tax=Candidatus Scatousia sp. TaxID=3085663 RepID=UPI004029013F